MSIKVKISTTGNPELRKLLLRQLPQRNNQWKNCEFFVDEDIDECDWWIIAHIGAIKEPETTRCDPEHVIFFSMEPIDWGPHAFYQQFASIYTCDPRTKHRKSISRNIHTWWTGIEVDFQGGHLFNPVINEDYDSLRNLAVPNKSMRISVITSNNQHWPGHTERLRFIDILKNSALNESIDFYGGGSNPIKDKRDGIYPYQFHLVLENSSKPDYWTEKLADSFLGYAFPIYHGCTNLNKYFPANSFLQIDINNPTASIQAIESVFSQDFYKSRLPAIGAARSMILDQYNFFNEASEICTTISKHHRRMTIRPPDHFLAAQRRTPRALMSRIKRKIIRSCSPPKPDSSV